MVCQSSSHKAVWCVSHLVIKLCGVPVVQSKAVRCASLVVKLCGVSHQVIKLCGVPVVHSKSAWCASRVVIKLCDVPDIQSYLSMVCQLSCHKFVWCASHPVTQLCDAPVIKPCGVPAIQIENWVACHKFNQ